MKITIRLAVAVLTAIGLLSGCATNPDGTSMSLSERWKAMAERQDAAARAFVSAD
jgi:hypothetical protein